MNNSNTITRPGQAVVSYYYKFKKQKNKNKSLKYYSFQSSDINCRFSLAWERKLNLNPNLTDNSGNYVAIKFYLQESGNTELILMDSDKNEVMYLINERLEAGSHTLITEISKEELHNFTYYCKLSVNGNSEVRKMEYVKKN